MFCRIAVYGTGFLGATPAASMAELCHQVVGVDVDTVKLSKETATDSKTETWAASRQRPRQPKTDRQPTSRGQLSTVEKG